MIAGIAHICGYDIKQDEVQTLCYICLTGTSASEIFKKVGINAAQKITTSTIKKYITREIITKINQAVGFRFITKSGTTGIINLTKIVPVLGGIIGGTFDAVTTNTVGNTARNLFYKDNQI